MAQFEVFDDAARFRDVTAELVARDRVGAVMLSGILANLIAEPEPGTRPLLACLTDVDGPSVAVLAFAGYPVQLLADPELRDLPGALRSVVEGLLAAEVPVVGFNGRREVVRQLSGAWSERTGIEPVPRMWTLYYRLRELVEPIGVPGAARPLNPRDPAEVALVAEWFARFQQETGVARSRPAADPEGVLRSVRRGGVLTLWCLAADPVSVAGYSIVGADATAKIAPVYTRPDRRRQRFGAAVTAAAVRSALTLGAADVTLFTDEDYLPSNELYRSLGFEPIAEFAEFDVPVIDVPVIEVPVVDGTGPQATDRVTDRSAAR